MSGKVFLIQSDFNTMEIGIIEGNKHKLTNFSGIDDVDNFNSKLLDYILLDSVYPIVPENVNYNNYRRRETIDNLDECFLLESNDIKGLIIDIWRYRLANAYVVIQRSAIRYRILIYIYDKVFHKGESFGTNIKGVVNEIKKNPQLIIKEIYDKINQWLNIKYIKDRYKLSLYKNINIDDVVFGV